MSKPITTKDAGICFAFPDVCWTPAPGGSLPIPYPNTGQLRDAKDTADTVEVNGNPVVTSNSSIDSTTGDQAGTEGIISKKIGGKVEFVTFSLTVEAEGGNVVRIGDTTTQNEGNAVGTVLAGVPNVLVGD